MRQMRIVVSILAVTLLLSACADVKTLESAGFENYEDGYRLLIESEKIIS